MGYVVCQDCGAHFNDSKVDITFYDVDEWDWVCPVCGTDNYKESGKKTEVTNPNRIPKNLSIFDYPINLNK